MTGPDEYPGYPERTYTQAELDEKVEWTEKYYHKQGRLEAIKEIYEIRSTVEHYRDGIPEQVIKRLDKLHAWCKENDK